MAFRRPPVAFHGHRDRRGAARHQQRQALRVAPSPLAGIAHAQLAFLPCPDPGRADNACFADFRNPTGNAWVLQERADQPTGIEVASCERG
jgi:hypothetical protein